MTECNDNVGSDILYRYLPRDAFQKKVGYYHPDPMIEEFTYGEGGRFSAFVWNNVGIGSRLFFHTTIGGTRYITAVYVVKEIIPAAIWRVDNDQRSKYRNPHLHPEDFPEWWGDDSESRAYDQETIEAYESGDILTDCDVMLIGDPSESIDLRKSPIVLDKAILSRLQLNGKPIKWDIVTKSGKPFPESQCVASCLRTPRILSRSDGDLLLDLAKGSVGLLRNEPSYSIIKPISSTIASKIQLECSSEADIERLIIENLTEIDPSLSYVSNQVILGNGIRIDILANDRNLRPVIIEVKKGTADDGTLAQLLSYIHQFQRERNQSGVFGKIVC